MSKKFFSTFVLLIPLLLCFRAHASHCAGGELLYEWVADSTYKVTFKMYRDCSSSTAAPGAGSQQLCYKNTCSNVEYSTIMNPVATLPGGAPQGSPVAIGCSGFPDRCASTSSTVPGYQEYHYVAYVTLPARCSSWEFKTIINARNANNNLVNSSNENFYVKATLNNLVAQGNSSPYFSVKPVPYVCVNNPYTYNNGAIDPNGDSLSFEMIIPQGGDCNTSGNNLSFVSASPALNIINNPLQTNNTFSIDAHTGQLSFTPTLLGKNTIACRVKEYRNNILIGSCTRDIQVQVLPCNNVQPTIAVDTPSIAGANLLSNGAVQTCAGTPFNFCFKLRSSVQGTVLVVSDNHAVSTPGATLNYTGQYTDSIYGCLSWTPSPLDTGLKILTITLKDSTCLPPGVVVSQTFVLPISISPTTNILKDTSICSGDTVHLTAVGGSVFNWSVLPGGAPLSSLSCTNCSNPVASPLVPTQYVVSSNLQTGCKSKDTVSIYVGTAPATPTAGSNSPVCKGGTLQLNASAPSATGYAWTGPNGFSSTAQNPSISNVQTAQSGTYTVRAKDGVCYSQPVQVNVNVLVAPNPPVVSGNSPVCEGGTIQMNATGATGVSYKWTGPNSFVSSVQNPSIANAGVQHNGAYSVKAYLNNDTACASTATVYNVVVDAKTTASFLLSRDTICQQDTILVTYTGIAPPGASLAWNFADGQKENGSGIGPFVLRWPVQGLKTISLKTSNGACVDSQASKLRVTASPSSAFYLQHDACLGELVLIKAVATDIPNVNYNWSFADGVVFTGSGRGVYNVYFPTPGYKVLTLSASNQDCVTPKFTDTIYVHPVPDAKITQVSIAPDAIICSGDSVQFEAKQVTDMNYKWLPRGYFIDSNQRVTTGKITNTGYVYVKVSDSYGCTAYDSTWINTQPCCDIYLPSAFSPNNDGHNDIFHILTIGHHTVTTFRIVNRWGQTVFETADESRGWAGYFAGAPADPGNYFYYVRYKCADGKYYEKRGDVMLLR